MPHTSASLATKCLTMLVKDLRLELRDKYALNAVLMFGITTLAVVSFSLGQRNLPPHLLGALFWVIMFFSAMSGLAHIFIREEESGTSLALRLAAPPDAVYIGKLLFNLILLSVLTVIITPLFFIFTNAPVSSVIDFIPILILGVLGLCSATTLIAAIIARAAVKGALFAVLSFPIIIPLLIVLVMATQKLFEGSGVNSVMTDLQFLLAYTVVMVVGSLMLFKFVWSES
ncbi:MAG: heme exporter protein CcmB [bacterium]